MNSNRTGYQVQRRGDLWICSKHVKGTLVRVFATERDGGRACLTERVTKFLNGPGRALDTWRIGRIQK